MHFLCVKSFCESTVKEGHNLGTGANSVRGECCFRGAVRNALLRCPCDCNAVIRIGGYICKTACFLNSGRTSIAIKQNRHLSTGTGHICAKQIHTDTRCNTILRRPQNSVVTERTFHDITKGITYILHHRRIHHAPEECYNLPTGARAVRAESIFSYAVCNLPFDCPQDSIMIIGIVADIDKRIDRRCRLFGFRCRCDRFYRRLARTSSAGTAACAATFTSSRDNTVCFIATPGASLLLSTFRGRSGRSRCDPLAKIVRYRSGDFSFEGKGFAVTIAHVICIGDGPCARRNLDARSAHSRACPFTGFCHIKCTRQCVQIKPCNIGKK